MADINYHYQAKRNKRGYYFAWVKEDPDIRTLEHKLRGDALDDIRAYHREVLESEKHIDELEEKKYVN